MTYFCLLRESVEKIETHLLTAGLRNTSLRSADSEPTMLNFFEDQPEALPDHLFIGTTARALVERRIANLAAAAFSAPVHHMPRFQRLPSASIQSKASIRKGQPRMLFCASVLSEDEIGCSQ